jgi:hypothetical protein
MASHGNDPSLRVEIGPVVAEFAFDLYVENRGA